MADTRLTRKDWSLMSIVEEMQKLNEEFKAEVEKVSEKVDLLVKGSE